MMETYEQRIIAYVDVLGWSSACNDLSRYSSLQTATRAIADYAHKFSPEVKNAIANSKGVSKAIIKQQGAVEFSFFSDNFAVSVPTEQADILFKILAFASHELLRAHFLVRGGVALGYLHHKGTIVFGPALVEAVDIEETKALYPRLLCSDEVVDFLDNSGYKSKVLVQDNNQEWVASFAVGSCHAQADLLAVIDDEIAKQTKITDKWRYMRGLLPLMYEQDSRS